MITVEDITKLTLALTKDTNSLGLAILADALEEAGLPFGLDMDDIGHLRAHSIMDYHNPRFCYVVGHIMKESGYSILDW